MCRLGRRLVSVVSKIGTIAGTIGPMILRAALIDMDGTIWDTPVRIAAVREQLGLPQDGRPILHGIAELPRSQRAQAIALLEAHEREGVERGSLRPGTHELLDFFRLRGVTSVLVTNNSRESTQAVLSRHGLSFDLVFTRDDGPLKPDPAAFLGPLARLGVPAEETLVLGDSHFDFQAAHVAGIRTVVLVSPPEWMRPYFPPDASCHEVPDLPTAQRVVERLLDKT